MNRSRAVVLGAATSLVALFFSGVHFFSSTDDSILQHPMVHDLNGFAVRYQIGRSPVCGNQECWLDKSFDDQSWPILEIPETALSDLPEYLSRGLNDKIYYRIKVTIPDELMHQDDVIAFSPSYVNHKRYEVFLDGHWVSAHSGNTIEAPLIIQALPPGDSTHSMVIRASLSESDTGIMHFGHVYLGPKHILDRIRIADERSNVTFFVITMVAKGSIFLVLAMILLLTRPQTGFSAFLVYAYCVTIEDLIRSSLFPSAVSLGTTYALYFTVRSIANGALVAFLCRAFDHPQWIRPTWLGMALFGGLWLTIQIGFPFQPSSTDVITLLETDHLVLALSLVVAVTAGFRRLRKDPSLDNVAMTPRRTQTRVVLGVTTIYLILHLWESLLQDYAGYEKRAIFDLGFFGFMTFLCLRDLGMNQRELVASNQKLAQSRLDSAIGKMAQMLAHDIAKPINMTGRFLRRLQQSPDGEFPHETLKSFEQSFTAARKKADRMIEEVLSAGQPQHLDLKPTNLERLVKLSSEEIPALEKGHVRLTCQWNHRSEVSADPRVLSRALTNILANGCEALLDSCREKEVPTMTLKTHETSDHIEIEIANQGPPIDPSYLPYIFEPFYSRGKSSGTGLGLAIAKRVADAHGGTIHCESSQQQTRFVLRIPRFVA